MKADLGSAALYLALVAVAYSIVVFISAATNGSGRALESGRRGMYAVLALLALASASLLAALLSHDFSLSYVASYTSLASTTAFTIAAFWAGNSGSLLFWALVLAICGLIFIVKNRDRDSRYVSFVSITILVTEALFLALMIFIENPFDVLPVPPSDGRGLNPLLENAGMIFHPPSLLVGYAGVTVPFALAVGALLTNRMDNEWIASVRRWALVFWLLLGVGNVLGMQWAYMELGWGGYWAWDPVENAGLLPWLTLTAFLHSIMIQKRRGSFKIWNVGLIGASYFLAIFGTFLTRSNILSSVHTFGESGMEPFFAFFITAGIVLFTSLVISSRAALRNDSQTEEALLSRETGFALNNFAFLAITIVVLLGTMSPLITRVLTGETITAEPGFFNVMVTPMLVLVVLLMGICPLLAWYRSSPGKLLNSLLGPIYAALGTAIGLVLLGATGITPIKPYAIIVFCICAFAVTTIILEWVRGSRARHRSRGDNYVKAFASLIVSSRSRYGGYIVHFGIILLAIGIAGSSAFGVTSEFTLRPGESSKVQDYVLTYNNLSQSVSSDRTVVGANLSVTKALRDIGSMEPKVIRKENFSNPVTEIALRTGPVEDLYVILTGYDQNAAAFKVIVNPLVLWMWIGGGLLLLGTIIAFWPAGRRRVSNQ